MESTTKRPQKLVDIDDELWARAKARAALDQIPLKDWLAETIRQRLCVEERIAQDNIK